MVSSLMTADDGAFTIIRVLLCYDPQEKHEISHGKKGLLAPALSCISLVTLLKSEIPSHKRKLRLRAVLLACLPHRMVKGLRDLSLKVYENCKV